MGTSSAEIATYLRSQILAGELRPGDALPSAREITRTWGVAIATASRVHALLRAEGLATPVRGVGTVVRTPASAARSRSVRMAGSSSARRENESDAAAAVRIVTAAVSIADVEGIGSLSTRRVAHAVQLPPTLLNRLHPTREDLVAGMLERTLREWSPEPVTGCWHDDLIAGHLELWRVFRRHPWAAPELSITRPQLIPGALAFAEWAIRTLTQAGISPEDALETHILLFLQARGTAILLEPEEEAESVTGMDADTWVDGRLDTLRELSSTENHAALRSLVGSGYALDLDRAYDRGLRLLVDGIASRIRSAQ
ncbi:GntR family transcriptional regulator [Microbacterium sp. ARD32]|uniref:GntR family transcriptional regulator n=1 Tax=Microbacterium sp. ARD32 TaxID=2962577 RepID=UPI0028828D86|nr:GntR family transcriptional regulator [Microbacterium sp. ARD32]MDT0156205.1 GntR family transcriptional regulator [Microbacterium sp. ARD32]